eukprot:1302396-Pyramimonas_sp.AAC.1
MYCPVSFPVLLSRFVLSCPNSGLVLSGRPGPSWRRLGPLWSPLHAGLVSARRLEGPTRPVR